MRWRFVAFAIKDKSLFFCSLLPVTKLVGCSWDQAHSWSSSPPPLGHSTQLSWCHQDNRKAVFVASQDVRSIVWTAQEYACILSIDVQGLDTSLFGLLHWEVKTEEDIMPLLRNIDAQWRKREEKEIFQTWDLNPHSWWSGGSWLLYQLCCPTARFPQAGSFSQSQVLLCVQMTDCPGARQQVQLPVPPGLWQVALHARVNK